MKRLLNIFCFLLIVPILTMGQASGQQSLGQSSKSVRGTFGSSMQYLDEPWNMAAGGSVRFQIYKRISIEPEFFISPGERFRQLTIIPNIVWDLGNSGKRVIPYIIGGLGYFYEVDKRINYSHNEMAWNGGIGVRIRTGDRLFLAPEFRIGHITRAVISVGYSF